MKLIVAFMSCVCLLLQGCTSLQAVPLPRGGTEPATVAVGDTVEATTKDGRVHRFEVTEVAGDALVGRDIRIAYMDITDLKAMRQDRERSRTVLWIAGGIALVGLLVGASGGSGSSY